MFTYEFSKELGRKLEKIRKKRKTIFDAVMKKIMEIKENPEAYKMLKYEMSGYRRVHIMKSFVLIFRVDNKSNKIIFQDFDHHDRIYRN